MLVTPGEEAWRVKEAKVGTDVPAMWGDWAERAIHWETITAAALVESGANVLVMRHPTAVKRLQGMVSKLMVH
jgi:acetyl-CoA decarbonylase/synthase, CODH/ACS complex subunit delta